ncbi:MAG TPA: tetrameric acyl-CoA thioesterase, partial [Anaerolineae bacterium]
MLGAGIRVDYLAPDLSSIRVQMKLTRLNVNLVGTHFGGSLYTMC